MNKKKYMLGIIIWSKPHDYEVHRFSEELTTIVFLTDIAPHYSLKY